MFKKLLAIIFKILAGWILYSLLLTFYLLSISVEDEAGEVVLSSSGGNFLAILTILITFGIIIWAVLSTVKNNDANSLSKISAKNSKKKLPPRERHLRGLFSQHKAQLVRNYNRTIIPNEYGAIDAKSIERWENEIIRFLESVNLSERLFKTQKHYAEAIDYTSQLTENYIRNLEQNAGPAVIFENITDPHIYEISCAKELELHGWQAIVSPVGADQGIDVRASKEGLHVVVQCKLYSSPVGNKAVQEALSGKVFDKADFAIVVAPNGFTRSATELAQSTGVLLLSHNDLKNLFELISSS